MPNHYEAESTPINMYLFLGTVGSVTMKGYFVDANGNQAGVGWTGTINGAGSGAAKNLLEISGMNLYPPGAVGCRVDIAGAIYVCQGGAPMYSDFLANSTTRYPTQAVATNITFGKVL